uniref:kinase suppressor of Ras 2-like isoform X2 n=1 Tax=Styela clava TaxID=7725 RepID=UPI00193ADB0A|nr:kinase suppressor of Ras 2-like isoform X2 [Styela clava]
MMPAETKARNWAVESDNAVKALVDIQSMIDIMSERLVALRDLRLQEFIKDEIRLLEGKLIKHFWRQLTTKCKVPKKHWTVDFQTYPSLSQWLTVVGINKDVNEILMRNIKSVETLLELGEHEVSTILLESGGNSEDKRKLWTALCQLKEFKDNQDNTEGVYWDSWCKESAEGFQNGLKNSIQDEASNNSQPKAVDHNENFRRIDQNCANTSTDEQRHANDSRPQRKHEILVHTASGRTTAPSWADADGQIQSPPSPSRSSRSSLSSCGPPSPPYGAKLHGFPQNAYDGGTRTPPANMFTPSYMRHYAQDHQNVSKTRSGQSSLTNTPPPVRATKSSESSIPPQNKAAANLLLPFGTMRTARSYEWQVGNHITNVGDESLTNSNVSLTSINTLPPPSSSGTSGSKLFSSGKKRRKHPGNIVIGNNEPPDFISLVTANRRSSQTHISPESGLSTCQSGSPMSPRTPMTPATPFNNEMWMQQRDFSPVVPQTPKTPGKLKGGFRAIKDKIKDKFGMRSHKLRRNKSEERVADEPAVFPTHHKIRSDTFPTINASSIIQSSHATLSTNDSRHNSTHSSSSSIASNQLMRMHKESASFDAGAGLSSGMTTPGEASMLSGRDLNFGFDSYFKSSSTNFTGTDNTLVAEETEPILDESTAQHAQDSTHEEDADSIADLEEESEDMRARVNLMRQTSTTSTMHDEWDIPWDELVLGDCIGKGRVGAVYRGKWHAEVAVRVIYISHVDDTKLRAFKHEVMLYKKTRHDNIELFMGSCMNPPRLAIITGICKGYSLYQLIRSAKDQQVPLNRAKFIAQHIAQGMGYLHSRGIIHKDLKTKNIFVDGNRIVVTDFGLMGLHAISTKSIRIKPLTLQVPDGWLCYMAPEIIRALSVPYNDMDVVSSLPYTKESDVYAFGTVWYELLTGCWPFKDYPAESITWQVGNGKKQSLAHLQGPKELKDILMTCWAYEPSQRPDFSDNGIMGQILRLPQAKMIRRGHSEPSMTLDDLPYRYYERFKPLLSPISASPSNMSGSSIDDIIII